MYEWKAKFLATTPPLQEQIINQLASEGWDLMAVSFNVGYFRRRKTEIGKEDKTIKG